MERKGSPSLHRRLTTTASTDVAQSKSDSRAKLDKYYSLLHKTVLTYQHPVTGLLPAFLYKDGTPGWAKNDAWVRDNVYSVLSIWAMSIAYRRRADVEDDRLRAYQLEQSVVKLMRSLLFCMMQQADRVENFKKTLDRGAALHAKYSLSTCSSVVGDYDWGHLQIDATSLYLLTLAQMTAAGLRIIYTLDEVAFVQNLVFYIEEAYRIPDYGIWERGDKTNHGETELNATSIGMAKAALEAISGLDLFGSRGGIQSVIHVLHDQVAQCDTKLNSLLPRESSSKEIDAGLLTIIGYPAFAVTSPALIQETKSQIIAKLQGRYGCKRFLRDGYQTVKEDSTRLHYEPAELKVFDGIECEWPLFYELLLLDALIQNDLGGVAEYSRLLEKVVPTTGEDRLQRVPELYVVPEDKVHLEYATPHSQPRVMGLKIQHMSSQSLFVLCGLLKDGLMAIGEIDPLNRRLSMMPRPDTLVQVVLLSEDYKLCAALSRHNIVTETIKRVERDPACPVKVLPASNLTQLYTHLGVNDKMHLTGRPPVHVGVIGTSQIYQIHGSSVVFTPSFLDNEKFYLCLDNRLLVDLVRTDLAYLKRNWRLIGRPTVVLPILRTMLGEESQWERSPVFRLLHTLAAGYTSGARVQIGLMRDFISTASIRKMHFINAAEVGLVLDLHQDLRRAKSTMLAHRGDSFIRLPLGSSPNSRHVFGSVRRSRHVGTPPVQRRKLPGDRRSTGESDPASTPDEHPVRVALAYSSQRRHSLLTKERLRKLPGESTPSRNKSFETLESASLEETVEKLNDESNIYQQADILNHLFNTCGKDYEVILDQQVCTVGSLLEELYQNSGASQLWSLVRHTAGMLGKRVEDLGSAATDLLVRQKHFSVGQPGNEIYIIQPIPPGELMGKIKAVCGDDYSAVALTQEIIVYLAMFIRSEPELFREMLRLRVGLIINVMISELSRTMKCSEEDAVEKLHELSPFDMKHVLHLIFSRKEFSVDEITARDSVFLDGQMFQMPMRQLSIVAPTKQRVHGKLQKDVRVLGGSVSSDAPLRSDVEEDKHGHWRRRRRLDGTLNRVPPDFYTQVWHILELSRGISIGNEFLPRSPTIQEMTPGELKFALRVEGVLNSLPHPEYRQLVVEAMMVAGLVAASGSRPSFGDKVLVVEHIIEHAQRLFLQDQKTYDGPAVTCCCKHVGSCGGPNRICIQLYDSAPSGRYGTMSYLAQAVSDQLRGAHNPNEECKIS